MKLFINDLMDNRAHDRNRDRVTGHQLPCLICGKGVDPESRTARAFWLHGGGAYLIQTEEDAAELGGPAADLGTYYIGADCYRRHRSVLEDFVIVPEAVP